jgi:hypothetical protein
MGVLDVKWEDMMITLKCVSELAGLSIIRKYDGIKVEDI